MKCEICDEPITHDQRTGTWFGQPAHRLCAEWGEEGNEKFRKNIWWILACMATFLFAAWVLPSWSTLFLIPLWYWAAKELFGADRPRPTQEEIEKDVFEICDQCFGRGHGEDDMMFFPCPRCKGKGKK